MATYILCLAVLFSRLASAADVFAHFMSPTSQVANTYEYPQTEWEADFTAASAIGIDGFALNWAPPDCSLSPNADWYVNRIDDAYTAAAANKIKLIHSFDMNYVPSACSIGWNTTFMASMISKYATNSAAYLWYNDLLVSTYAGEGYGNEFFTELKSLLASEWLPIHISPRFTTYSLTAQTEDPTSIFNGMLSDYSAIDGFLNSWPADTEINLTATVDVESKTALENADRIGPYIMGVSPWQFKDLDDDAFNSWVEYSDFLFPNRWTQAISTVKPDIVEIITWNDFPKPHYIRDLPPTSGPGSVQLGTTGDYVYGQTHAAWRVMVQYYTSWFKNGSPPAVAADRVVFWYRIHPKVVSCTGGTDNSGVVRNAAYPVDAVFAWALVTEDSTISMTVGSNEGWAFEAVAGTPTLNMVPFPVGNDNAYPTVVVEREGATLQTGIGPLAITQACSWENYNPVVVLAGPSL
ncbi:hypothetical protein LTR49_022140 [Elasticomyces elasticus]|nr:hypothetical protein LTR49_022140 [Elasticomyces elasticus]